MKVKVKELHTFTYKEFTKHIQQYLTNKYNMCVQYNSEGIQITDILMKYTIPQTTLKMYYEVYTEKGISLCHNMIDQQLYHTLLDELLCLVQQNEQTSEFVS